MNITLFDIISLVIGVSMVVSMLWIFVISHIYTDEAESYLSNCEYIKIVRGFCINAGLLGKTFRNVSLVLMLISPKSLARKGFADLEEVKSFPLRLKRILYTSWGVATIFFAGTMIIGIYEKYKDVMGY